MAFIRDDKMGAEPVDDATKAAIEEALEEARNGNTMSMEEARAYIKKEMEAWRKTKKKPMAA